MNTEPHIFIYDEFNPEDIAMMQALYSRSAESVEVHVEKVKKTGSGSFMEKFYVGYGHASIADCGSTTIFIEGVSMLAAKAIQDWPLYSGQETSSRYVNMAEQSIADPLGTNESEAILKEWLRFYVEAQEPLREHLMSQYPKKEGEDEAVYVKAIKARSFDILRGFLPAGSTTQLSWHTNLRQAYDKLALLVHHPLQEVRTIAESILDQLKKKYAHSFSHKQYVKQEAYRDMVMKQYTYYAGKRIHKRFVATTSIRNAELKDFKKIIKSRPQKTNLPHILNELGHITYEFMIDFGSFRDIQRHRNGVCRMPRLTTAFGFEHWYLQSLPPALEKRAIELIKRQKAAIKSLKTSPDIKQYYCAMGFLMCAKVTYALPAAVYVMELRSTRMVHPTLRRVAHDMYYFMKKRFPEMALHADLDLDDWDIRRGLQDIKEK